MIEIKCPRCEQYWYDSDDEEDSGRVRLCSRCVDHLRLKRGHRAEIDILFLIVAGIFLLFDAIMVALAALLPAAFAQAMLVLGGILFISGTITLRFLVQGRCIFLFGIPIGGDIDWHTGRWAVLLTILGLFLMGACGSIAAIKRKRGDSDAIQRPISAVQIRHERPMTQRAPPVTRWHNSPAQWRCPARWILSLSQPFRL